ncbi:lysyl-tRNA synthetase [Coemansia reversa NRRL 1564]|uniref:Lysine--tRNA ligase n=1 Tax=Coemansia reversa (strain ATCC 12441 / NRRL 1564) TaxID=763665 RepID=A0A2G5BFT2_COERN|nr:lysyl-tRNA synthetase [Coemansia reversa NRRL 1564]|eukprot:PIA17875.1 lysyl-tRNA synthetase [Coemansia reversa NRRL 1564]
MSAVRVAFRLPCRETVQRIYPAIAARSQTTAAAPSSNEAIKKQRQRALNDLGLELYPRYTLPPMGYPLVTHELVHSRWGHAMDNGAKLTDVQLTVQGRIISKREASKKLFFFDIEQDGQTVQVVSSQARFTGDISRFRSLNRTLMSGDIIRASGFVGKTNTGETSVFAVELLELLAPCLRPIPLRSGFTDSEKRFRSRHLDLLVNPKARRGLIMRSQVLQYIRSFLDARQFVEVETPILSPNVGGASARPFTTTSMAFGDTPLFMRVAPELYLKQLVIGGLNRVYEIGKQFRNEGVDADHNPEFTTCEFYQAYASLEDLMQMSEDMLRGMVKKLTGSTIVKQSDGIDSIDFGTPFRRLDVMKTLCEHVPELSDLDNDQTLSKLQQILEKHHIVTPHPHTVPRLLDRLIGHYIEPQCIQPTFLYGHPAIMSPLAKCADRNQTIAARFELFINGKELVNAYEELNDPDLQRQKFRIQSVERIQGDEEVPPPDIAFCNALESALPPTAGWGMGIDRLVALLAGLSHLRETISFPIMRPTSSK